MFSILTLFCLGNVQSAGYRYVAYYADWDVYGRNFQPANIPVSKITHLNYAFANVNSAGQIILGDEYADTQKSYPGDSWDTTKQAYMGAYWQLFKVIKPQNPNLKILISVGGWTWSGSFSTIAATPASRTTFANSVAAFLQKYPFDGVDIDWEYPVLGGLSTNIYSPNDGANYVLLLQALRNVLGTKLLTVAAPAGPHITKYLQIAQMAQYVDFINIMTYDFRGGWSTYTGHHAPLYPQPSNSAPSDDPDVALTCTSDVVNYYITNGFPAIKINIGFAMYGRGWSGVPNVKNGIYQKFTTVPQGTWDDWQSGHTGVFDYSDVANKLATGGFTRYWDSAVNAPWVYNAATGVMISYDDVQSVKAKINYVMTTGLGGIMTWEISGDTKSNELTNTVFETLLSGVVPPNPPPPPSGTPNPPPAPLPAPSPNTGSSNNPPVSSYPSGPPSQTNPPSSSLGASDSSSNKSGNSTSVFNYSNPAVAVFFTVFLCILSGAGGLYFGLKMRKEGTAKSDPETANSSKWSLFRK